MLTVTFRRRRRFGVATLAGLVISGVTLLPAAARPTPTPQPSAPEVFACATTLFPFTTTAPTPSALGTRTPNVALTTPAPELPEVTSSVGGPLLGATGRLVIDTRDAVLVTTRARAQEVKSVVAQLQARARLDLL